MKTNLRRLEFIALLGLLAIAVVGLLLTSELTIPSLRRIPGRSRSGAQTPLVDQKPLTTAENLAVLAVTPGEKQFAEEALELGDQEVDLAFAMALRRAAAHPQSLTSEAQKIQSRLKQADQQVRVDQEEVDRLTKLVATARGERKSSLEIQLQSAQSQLALAQDDLEDARRDLARAGGSELDRLKRELEEHAKSQSHANLSAPAAGSGVGSGASAAPRPRSLIAQVTEWNARRDLCNQVLQAQLDARALALVLVQQHDALERDLKQVQPANAAPASKVGAPETPAGAVNPAAPAGRPTGRAEGSEQDLAELDKRIEATQKLDDTYGRWSTLERNRELRSLHRAIWSGFWIVLIVLVTFIAETVLSRFFLRLAPDRKLLHTSRSVIYFSLRVLCLFLILLVVFGPPSQLATVVALAGAGLTVALRDFIVGFFGWFLLMGRNGVRPGDWVEINGVQGKVIEVGLLHTVLLETGNWTAAGHPTGRKVTFVNSYAIEGHYFNFSTAGQWLWDEIQIGLPAAVDPYPVVGAVQKIVLAETEATSRLAEQEWQRAAATSGLHSVSSAPAISVRPTDLGVNVVVRYVTRADERVQLRSRLYHAVFEFLIRRNVVLPDADAPAPPSPASQP
jgi:small-conductance mechanosensitive channel